MTMTTANDRIFTILEQMGTECPLEEVLNLCPDITWNQMFLAIDHLSRTGRIRVRLDSDRTYWVRSYSSCHHDGVIDHVGDNPEIWATHQ